MRRAIGAALAAAVLVAMLGLTREARAEEQRVTLGLRGGVLDRDDDGYADHASVFGLGDPEVAGGGVVELGVRAAPRLWLYASWSGFASLASRRQGELGVRNQALLGQVGLTVLRLDIDTGHLPLSLRADVLAGGGLYVISDELDGEAHRATAPGARGGAQVTLSWHSIGFTVAYGHHVTRASIEDRVGGALRAGGNELGVGLALGF